eukprot:scaffold95701_cov27-Tisochrysis_lutea.AAC.1
MQGVGCTIASDGEQEATALVKRPGGHGDQRVALGAKELHAVELSTPTIKLPCVVLEGGKRLRNRRCRLLFGVRIEVPILAKDVDDAVFFENLRVVPRALEVVRQALLRLALHPLKAHRLPHNLGDIGALDAPYDEVGLKRPHVQEAGHGVHRRHHALKHCRDGRVKVLQRWREGDLVRPKVDRCDPHAILLSWLIQPIEEALCCLDDKHVACRHCHIVGEPDEVTQHLRLRLRLAHSRRAVCSLLLGSSHRLGFFLFERVEGGGCGIIGRGHHGGSGVVAYLGACGDVLADLFYQRLKFVDDLLESFGCVSTRLSLRGRREQLGVLASAQLVAESVDLEQCAAEGGACDEEALGELTPHVAVQLVSHVCAPQTEDLCGEVMPEEAYRLQHVEEGGLLHPCREGHELGRLRRAESVRHAVRRHGEILRLYLLTTHHHQIIWPEVIARLGAVEVDKLDGRVVAAPFDSSPAPSMSLSGTVASEVDPAASAIGASRLPALTLLREETKAVVVVELLDLEAVQRGLPLWRRAECARVPCRQRPSGLPAFGGLEPDGDALLRWEVREV